MRACMRLSFQTIYRGTASAFLGGLWGAIELFVLVFVGSVLLAGVYNKIVEIRHRTS